MRKWSLALSCFVLATSLTACGYNRTAAPQPGTGTNTQSVTHPSTVGTTAYRATAPNMYNATAPGVNGTAVPRTYGTGAPHTYGATGTQHTGMFNHQLANRAAKAADAVPGVNGAVAVVSGNDVLVGINVRVDANHTRQRHAIEQQAYSAVKAGLPHYHVRITSDSAMVARINALDNGIRHQYGYPAPAGTHSIVNGPTTVAGNARNLGADFGNLVRDMGRTVTAPFR